MNWLLILDRLGFHLIIGIGQWYNLSLISINNYINIDIYNLTTWYLIRHLIRYLNTNMVLIKLAIHNWEIVLIIHRLLR